MHPCADYGSLRDYCVALEIVDIAPDGAVNLDSAGDDSDAVEAFTVRQRVESLRYLILPTDWTENVASQGRASYRLKPAHAAMLSYAASKVESLLSRALDVSWRERFLEPPASDWVVEACAPLDEFYPNQLYVSKVFKFARSWLHYAATLLEFLLYMRERSDLPDSQPEPFDHSLAAFAASATPMVSTIRTAPSSGRTIRPGSAPPSSNASPTTRAARVPLPSTPPSPVAPRTMSPKSEEVTRRLRLPSPPQMDWYTQAPKTNNKSMARKNRRVTMDVPPSPFVQPAGAVSAFHMRVGGNAPFTPGTNSLPDPGPRRYAASTPGAGRTVVMHLSTSPDAAPI